MTDTQSRISGRPPRVLLAWEFGAGRTHMLNLAGVAAHLRQAGVEGLASLYETRFAPEFGRLDIPVIQNYVWPARRRAPLAWAERPARGFGDVLANIGVANTAALRDAIAHYDGLIDVYGPDIVLAENAPGAILAGRERVPVIALGTSSCLPPRAEDGLALYSGAGSRPSWPAAEVLIGINNGLFAADRAPLPNLSALFDIHGVYPFGPAPFDAYAGQRSVPVLPPYVPDMPARLPDNKGGELFVYLHGFVQQNEHFMTALADIDRPMRVYIPGLEPRFHDLLARRGVRVEEQPVPVTEILERSTCVLHHGGHQLTSICLAAGVPQAILAKEIDNRLAGRFLDANGIGAWCELRGMTVEQMQGLARSTFDDGELHERARAFAPRAAEWFPFDPTRRVADAVLELLGVC